MIIGATADGKKEFVGLADGIRESVQSWKRKRCFQATSLSDWAAG